MSRSFLTGLNLNKNELLNARIQNLPNAPSSPVAGQIYYNTGDNTLRYWNGTAWLTLAQGGSVTDAINTAINALDTDDIEEGSSNLYYTTSRAKTDAAALLTSATLTNITITGNGSGLTISAENGVADSDTDDLTEGTSNLYFTNERAQDAVGNSVGDGITYNDTTGAISVKVNPFGNGVLGFDGSGNLKVKSDANTTGGGNGTGTLTTQGSANELKVNTDVIASKAHVDGLIGDNTVDGTIGNTVTDRIATVNDALGDHISDTTTHGVTGNIVGTSDTQTLTNKTLGTGTTLADDLDADGYSITNVATPVNSGDAANKAYVDSTAQGLDVKASVHAATTVAGTLATSFEAGDSIDGHTLSAGDRILIKNQADSKENGIYVVNASGAPTRAIDADTDAELTKGSFVFVENGSQASTGWVLSTVTGSLDATGSSRVFTQFSGAGLITAGDGLTKTGNQLDVVGTSNRITVNADSIDIASTYVGQSSITTLGTITTGVWNGTDIAVADGGTGASTAAGARQNLGATTKYTEANPELTVSSGSVTWTVTHNLGIRTVVVQVYSLDGYDQVEVDVTRTDNNTVTLSWVASATVSQNTYQVVIVG